MVWGRNVRPGLFRSTCVHVFNSILAAGVLKYVAGGKEATYRTAMRVREEVLKMMQEIIKLPGSFRY